MTAPTSPKLPMPADPNDLHTALTKAIDRADTPGGMRAGTASISVAVLRTLLAAHPAPETRATLPVPDPTGHEFDGVAGHPDDDECTYRADGTDRTYCGARKEIHTPAPVSDTRRGDVARALLSTLGGYWCGDHMFDEDDDNDVVPDCCQVARLERARDLADVALAVLPAPRVVDEATETVVEYLLLGHPAWPGDLATRDEESAARWLAEHQEDVPRIWVDRRVTTRQPWTARLRGENRG